MQLQHGFELDGGKQLDWGDGREPRWGGVDRLNQLAIETNLQVWAKLSEAEVRNDAVKFFAGVGAIDEGNVCVSNVGGFGRHFQGKVAPMEKQPAACAWSDIAFHGCANSVPADIPANPKDGEVVRNELDSEASRLADSTILEWTVVGQDSRSSSSGCGLPIGQSFDGFQLSGSKSRKKIS